MNKRVLITAISLSTMALLTSCGVSNNSGSSTCTSNVDNSQLKIYVSRIGGNSYSMQLCAPSNGDLINVYGSNSLNNVTGVALYSNGTLPRLEQVSTFIQSGSVIQVDFHSSDSYFAIYPVVFAGGTYVSDFNHPLVPPQHLPN